MAILPFMGKEATPAEALHRAAEGAELGRQLAIYEEDTRFLAKWYFILRCDEECYRADRYGRELALLLVQVTGVGDEFWDTANQVGDWLMMKGRKSDILAYLGNGQFAALLPETDVDGVCGLASRLLRAVSGLAFGISYHPDDGRNFEQLIESAEQRLDGAVDLAS